MSTADRIGTTSRVRAAPGDRHPWTAPGGHVIDLPVVVDIMHVDPEKLTVAWSVEATIDCVGDAPAIVGMHVQSAVGIDPASMHANFRWATPLELVTQTVPELLSLGIDPFSYSYPLTGYPNAAYVQRALPSRLSDAFLESVVLRYLAVGRGYARAIAAERNVSPRTVVSWIEKARERGILTATQPGVFGGSLAKPSDDATP